MITETRINSRKDTSVPFFLETDHQVCTEFKAGIAPFIANGSVTRSDTWSSDNLTVTRVKTFDSIDTFVAIENLCTIANDVAWQTYLAEHGSNFVTVTPAYIVTGIDSPFDYIVTYSFASGATLLDGQKVVDAVPAAYISRNGTHITNVAVTDTSIEITHHYVDCADFSAHFPNDLGHVTTWISAGLTRSNKIILK